MKSNTDTPTGITTTEWANKQDFYDQVNRLEFLLSIETAYLLECFVCVLGALRSIAKEANEWDETTEA